MGMWSCCGRAGAGMNVNHLLKHLSKPLAQAWAQSPPHPYADVLLSGRDTEFIETTQRLRSPGLHAETSSF